MKKSKNTRFKVNKNLGLLMAGRAVSDMGSSIQMIVMPLYLLDMGGSGSTIGLFSFLYLLPILLIYPFGGVIGDRLNRKKITVSADLFSGIIVLLSYLSLMDSPFYYQLLVKRLLIINIIRKGL